MRHISFLLAFTLCFINFLEATAYSHHQKSNKDELYDLQINGSELQIKKDSDGVIHFFDCEHTICRKMPFTIENEQQLANLVNEAKESIDKRNSLASAKEVQLISLLAAPSLVIGGVSLILGGLTGGLTLSAILTMTAIEKTWIPAFLASTLGLTTAAAAVYLTLIIGDADKEIAKRLQHHFLSQKEGILSFNDNKESNSVIFDTPEYKETMNKVLTSFMANNPNVTTEQKYFTTVKQLAKPDWERSTEENKLTLSP